jgi:hypothetical protein
MDELDLDSPFSGVKYSHKANVGAELGDNAGSYLKNSTSVSVFPQHVIFLLVQIHKQQKLNYYL